MENSKSVPSTLSVTIRYLSQLRDRTGRREEVLSREPGVRLKNVADYLEERYGFVHGDRRIIFTLNGKGWSQLPEGLSTALRDGDTVLLFPPVSGG